MLTCMTETISVQQSKKLPNLKFRYPTTPNISLSSKLKQDNSEIGIEFKGTGLKQDKVTFSSYNVAKLFIVIEIDRWSQNFTLKYCFFGTVRLTKNADPDKHSYARNGIEFDSCSHFSVLNFD